ncbi:hypothetical protein [Streptomyces albus]|uniref:hypothetical protein n=1 Tax=Streptomyces albus TaxID=1888 RepID=UPI00131B9AAC|nr:hypothetical protein [Streptomyces albus]
MTHARHPTPDQEQGHDVRYLSRRRELAAADGPAGAAALGVAVVVVLAIRSRLKR